MVWSPPPGVRMVKRYAPPTRKSISHTGKVMPSQPYHFLTCSALVMASKTRRRGASNTRVSTISRSDGVVTFRALPTRVSTRLLLFCRCLGFHVSPCFGFFLRLQRLQVIVEPVEILVPEPAGILQPAVGLREGGRCDAARPPLRLPAARDQSRMLQHLQVLRDRGHAHGKRLRQFGNGSFAERQSRQNRPPRRIGKRGEGGGERVGHNAKPTG